MVKEGDSEIEIALDRGEVKAGEHQEPICELELELLSGTTQDILTLARRLLDTGVLRQGSLSKAARGYHLAQGNEERPLTALTILRVAPKASVEQGLEAALESARINLNWTTVTAPIAGRIGISSVTPGALVSADQDTALATIRGLDTMYVDLTRSSVDLLRLRKQSLASNSDTLNVTLTLEDGSTYSEKGRLALTEVAVDESTGSVTLRAVFPNPQHVLLPGMFVRARIDEGIMNDAILAPQQGITRDTKGDATALVVDANNKVEQRSVETGETYGDKWLIVNGLKSGDRLIVEGTGKVAPGQQVKAAEVKNDGGNA